MQAAILNSYENSLLKDKQLESLVQPLTMTVFMKILLVKIEMYVHINVLVLIKIRTYMYLDTKITVFIS